MQELARLRRFSVLHRLQKYWLAHGLSASEQANKVLREKEAQTFFFLSGAALPFLIYLLTIVYTPATEPLEFWFYLILAVYDAALFLTARFKKDFKRRIRPFIVYAMPIAALVQYINMYIHGPTASNMLGSIGCIVYASALIRRHSESLFYLCFFSVVTAICAVRYPTPDMLAHYVPSVIACLAFLGISQFFKVQNSKIQIEKSQILSNSLMVWTHITENASVSMALTDLEGVVVDFSYPSGVWERFDVVGKKYVDFIPEDQKNIFNHAVDLAKTMKKGTSFKITFPVPDGIDQTFATTVWPVIEDEVLGFMFFSLDVSAEHLMDQRIQQNAQMAILGELSATIAHEIRNPLTVISGNIEVMLGQIEKGAPVDDLMPRIEKVKVMTERIGTIVKNVRRMYHPGEAEPVLTEHVSELIKDATSFCAQKCLEKNIRLQVRQSDPSLTIQCKPLLVSQAILNLLHNSIDAAKEFQDKWIRIDVSDLGNHVLISVIDSGKGLPEKILSNIGKPFFTTKPAGSGNGLGINLAKRVVIEHGGEFKYDGQSKNTKFDLILPKVQHFKSVA